MILDVVPGKVSVLFLSFRQAPTGRISSKLFWMLGAPGVDAETSQPPEAIGLGDAEEPGERLI